MNDRNKNVLQISDGKQSVVLSLNDFKEFDPFENERAPFSFEVLQALDEFHSDLSFQRDVPPCCSFSNVWAFVQWLKSNRANWKIEDLTPSMEEICRDVPKDAVF